MSSVGESRPESIFSGNPAFNTNTDTHNSDNETARKCYSKPIAAVMVDGLPIPPLAATMFVSFRKIPVDLAGNCLIIRDGARG